ncbi:MAG: nicotinate-nucleotide adenylyltransferase [Coriobacteriales bacterium]|nr:nicotinate-nucleotide adenylyltransferase [Coriobacteriales bacterium]
MSSDFVISSRFDALIDKGGQPFRLGLFGGTFDPVHIGHLHVAQRAWEQFSLDGVLFVPTGKPVRKLGFKLSAAEDRYTMLKAAIAGNERFDVSRIEIERAGVTYTIDTLRVLKERFGEKLRLFFIVGSDAQLDIVTWKEADEIATLVTVLSAQRKISQDSAPLLPHNGNSFDIRHIDSCPLDVSSHELREWVRQGHSIQYLVPDVVYAYIKEQRLYQD